jgi:hypothetical protein
MELVAPGVWMLRVGTLEVVGSLALREEAAHEVGMKRLPAVDEPRMRQPGDPPGCP